ncbi:MAG: hypothetical protein JRN03_05310 [Nitrososphaerota archaeon]|nr:hypothetical protein [Nitrososphaerota archaeon]
MIVDHSKEDKSTMNYISIEDVASLTWSQPSGKVKTSGLTLPQFTKKVEERYTSITERSHKALLPSLYKKLVTIPDVDVNMRPLRKILVGITRNGKFSPEELGRPPEKAEQVHNYFVLLSDLHYIKRENGGYVAGQGMKHLEATELEPYQLYQHILADVLREYSPYLKEVMRWTMITPFLRWCHSYYRPALSANSLLQLEQGELNSYYTMFYGPWHVSHDESQIDSIVQAKILAYPKGQPFIHGYQPILDEYLENARKDPMLDTVLFPRGN